MVKIELFLNAVNSLFVLNGLADSEMVKINFVSFLYQTFERTFVINVFAYFFSVDPVLTSKIVYSPTYA